MATQTVTDAIAVPQDPGTGTSSKDDAISAAIDALMARYDGEGSYVDRGLAFANVDTTNDEVDVTAGEAFIEDDSTSTSNDRGSGGNPQVQSTSTSGYDTEIPENNAYLVVLPTDQTNLSLGTDNVNDVFLSVDPTAQNSVTLHFGNGISTPSDPSVTLGTVNTSSGATTRSADKRTTGTVTASTGSTPATDTVIATGIDVEGFAYTFDLYTDPDTSQPDADYDFNHDYSHNWNDSAGEVEIDLTVNWDTDPGSDVECKWELVKQ